MTTTPKPFAAWPLDDLLARLVQAGLRPTQAGPALKAVARAYHREGRPWPEALGEASARPRALLAGLCTEPRPLVLAERAVAADRTQRLLLRTTDGEVVETVIIPSSGALSAEGGRTTLCVSSQVGCGRRCAFCETGRLGLVRNLGADEIVEQLRIARAVWAADRGDLPEITNIVFMGMGEPLDNLVQVADAVAIFGHDYAYGLSHRRITVSTVGVAWRIAEFFARCKAHLALSLNAPDDARRSQLMPVNQRCGLQELKQALLQALPPGRDVLVEYVLFAGFNDAPADAELLRAWLDGLPVRLNLIPANPGPDPRLRAPSAESVRRFQKQLLDAGVRALVRHPHGRDVGGACGQLAGEHRRLRAAELALAVE